MAVICSDLSCEFNKSKVCQKEDIYISSILLSVKESGRARIENICKSYQMKGKKGKQ